MSPSRSCHTTHTAEQADVYRRQGYWGDATLLDCWNATRLRHPDKCAVIDAQGTSLSFAEADELASRIAAYLLMNGVEPGDVVSCQLPGWAEFLPIYIGVLRAGAVMNPLSPGLRYREASQALRLCRSKVLFIPRRYRHFAYEPLAARLLESLPGLQAVVADKYGEGTTLPSLHALLDSHAPLSPSDAPPRGSADNPAAILFTSGSEGTPKGVMLSHNNILFSENSFAAHLNITQFDTMLMPAPVTHATGFHHGVTLPFLVGATTVVQDVFAAGNMLRLLEQHHCTVSMATPSFVHDLLRELETASYDLSALRFFLCGGAPLNPRMMDEAARYGITICNIYGSTESVPHVGVRPHDSVATRSSTAGYPMPGIEIAVVDGHGTFLPPGKEGQQLSRGPQIFLGYLGQPELTRRAVNEQGWYASGDRALVTQEGSLRVTGRIKDVIIRGGVNISSMEVETMLLMHPKILEAAVVGMPDPRLVERICAYVVLRTPEEGLTFEELCTFLDAQDIMKQKFPERLELVSAMPKTASGKIRKTVLRQDIARKLRREAARQQTDSA